MDHRKLFQVLVVGGALLGASCVEEEGRGPGDGSVASDSGRADADAADGAAGVVPDGAAADGALDGAMAGSADAGEGLTECGFCPNDECCEINDEGESQTREGLVCCWSTSC